MKTVNTTAALCQLPIVQAVLQQAHVLGITPYLVGGSVRDALLTPEKPIMDYDFLILNGEANTLVQQLVQLDVAHTRVVCLDADWGIYRWVLLPQSSLYPVTTVVQQAQQQELSAELPPIWVDIANALENNLHTDLHRRDLTINALAVDITTGQLIDAVGGMADLTNRRIRMINPENLVDDPLRLLRVFRFMAYFGNTAVLDADTAACVSQHTLLLNTVAMERCNYEFLKLLSYPQAFGAVQAMADCGLLEALIPELTACRKIPPNSHHHLPLWEHTLELVRQTETLYNVIDFRTKNVLDSTMANCTNGWGVVKLGCLLHDIGKPATWAVVEHPAEPEGKHTFIGHEKVGEDMTEALLKRWKLSGELSNLVKKLVRWHLYPCQFGVESSRKSVLRFFRKLGVHTPHVTVLALADRLSTCGVAITPAVLATAKSNHLWLLQQYFEELAVLQAPRLLSGETVMQTLGLSPGKAVGVWLKRLEEVQQLGEITTPAEATQWLVQQYQREKNSGAVPT
jgi:poly(A) polymerase